jgi:hypothetical protein
MAWSLPTTTEGDRDLVLGPARIDRVHAVEYGWLQAIQNCKLFVYRLPAADFVPFSGPGSHAVVADRVVFPLSPPEPVGDLLLRHAEARIELRLVDDLRAWWNRVIGTSVGYSGIRLANAVTTDRP